MVASSVAESDDDDVQPSASKRRGRSNVVDSDEDESDRSESPRPPLLSPDVEPPSPGEFDHFWSGSKASKKKNVIHKDAFGRAYYPIRSNSPSSTLNRRPSRGQQLVNRISSKR